MSLTPQFLDELRARTLLSSLIGKTVKLQKAGREFRACCPFHNEKTPSFYVNDDKGFYHCFGCSAHGDAIRWLTDQRGLPFIDAVKELVQAAGMEMPEQDRLSVEKAQRAKGLHEAMADAAAWFAEKLNGIEGAEARALLARRGFKPEIARKFGIGFSPDSRGGLRAALKTYGDEMLIEAGLLIRIDGKEPYDRFRGRLMIPIRDARGRAIAFGGRIIGDGEPKYLNSPDTPLFDKGRTLYNLDFASAAARKTGRVIAVEGYMDVIALAQAGFDDAVAPLGTALTEHQLERLWRLTDQPILCFDGDVAGQKAAVRAAHRALPLLHPGRRLAFATLPRGQDPDDLISSSGPGAFREVLDRAILLPNYIWRSELAALSDNPGPDERAMLKHRLLSHADTISDAVVKREYRGELLDLFFQTFGVKKKGLQIVREAIGEARRHPGRGVEYALHRGVLLGLMRYPTVLRRNVELVHDLPIKDRYLDKWRNHLLNIMLNSPNASQSVIEQILDQTDVSPIEERDFKRDLAFSFFRNDSDIETAEADLQEVMNLLVDDYENKRASKLANRAFEEEITQERFTEQQRILQAGVARESKLADWLARAAQESRAA